MSCVPRGLAVTSVWKQAQMMPWVLKRAGGGGECGWRQRMEAPRQVYSPRINFRKVKDSYDYQIKKAFPDKCQRVDPSTYNTTINVLVRQFLGHFVLIFVFNRILCSVVPDIFH